MLRNENDFERMQCVFYATYGLCVEVSAVQDPRSTMTAAHAIVERTLAAELFHLHGLMIFRIRFALSGETTAMVEINLPGIRQCARVTWPRTTPAVRLGKADAASGNRCACLA
jgi:hypothetical protein